jgi:FKBP-type peptidyl-prolyl cis-trans isomerase (trigger factor)
MPDDFAIEDLRGLQVEYTVVIKGVKSERLPSLESLAGGSEEGVAALRELVKTEMLLERTRVRARALDSELLSFLHRAVDFELPPEMVRAYAQRSVNDLVRENQSMGVSDEIIRGQEEAIVEAAGHRARRELKTEFILSEISRREGIALTNEELREAVNDIAKSVGFSYSKTMQRLVQNRRIREVGTKRLFRKVLDFLIDRAKIVEEEPNETAPPSAS